MKIFLLAGQSFSNKEWIEDVEKEFKKEFPNTEVIYYEHWKTGEEYIDMDKEVSKFLKAVDSCNEQYIIFAKSIGTIVLLNSIEKLKNKPKEVVMVGVSYLLALKMGYSFKNLKKKADFKINIYQKKYDPAGSLEKVEDISGDLVKVNEYECKGEENDNHHYGNMEYLLELVKDLID
jgi:hypothetical protein